MAEEELLFEASVNISEGAVLGLEEWAEASTWCDDVKPSKEVVVHQGNDMRCCCEHLAEEDALHGGVIDIAFEWHDEERFGPCLDSGEVCPR